MIMNMSITIFGNVAACRTEAEIGLLDNDGGVKILAVVFETADGWNVEMHDESVAHNAPNQQFAKAVEDAKKKLQNYINRRGDAPPEGLNPAGLSLWLMTKTDGTAMGQKI